MPKNKDFSLRIEILDECLRRRQRKWFIEDLLDEVNKKLNERYGKEVSKRTLQYDIDYLINDKLAPIEKCREGQRVFYKYTDLSYSVFNLPISEEEITKLKDAIKILREVNEFNLLDDVDMIVEKLEHTISTNVPESRSMIQFEKHTYTEGAEYLDDLFAAIKEKTVLKIAYQPFGAEQPQEWIMHPYLLKEYRNRWFLIGRRDLADRISNLALDRIKEIKNSAINFIDNNLFEPDTYYKHLIGVTFPKGEEIQEIILKVKGKQINYIKTKPIHKTQEIVEEPDKNTLIIKLMLINNYELQSVLLSYTPDIEVLQPVSLRNEMIDKYAVALEVNK